MSSRPLKHARLDYVVQKATELGARRLRPVITQRTIAERVNLERMRANVIEAAEQCNLVFVPEVLEPVKLEACLREWEQGRRLVYCDETAASRNPLDALKGLAAPAAVLIGPEGGFTVEEKALLRPCLRHADFTWPAHHAGGYRGRCGPDPGAGRAGRLGQSRRLTSRIVMEAPQIFVLPDPMRPPTSSEATRKYPVSGPTPDTPKARMPIETKAQLVPISRPATSRKRPGGSAPSTRSSPS